MSEQYRQHSEARTRGAESARPWRNGQPIVGYPYLVVVIFSITTE